MEDRVKNLEDNSMNDRILFSGMASDIKNISKNIEKVLNMERDVTILNERQKVNEVRIKDLEINLTKINEKVYIFLWIISVLSFIIPIILKKIGL